MKRIITVILSIITLLSVIGCLSACGKNGDNKNGDNENGVTVWYLGGSNVLSGKKDPKTFFENAKDTIDPEKIYSSVTFNEDMLHGVYTLNNKEKDIKSVRKDIPFEEVAFSEDTYKISALPVTVYSGADYIARSASTYKYADYKDIADSDVAVLEFATEEGTGTVICIYEVSGNKVKYTEIDKVSSDGEPFAYETGKAVFEYEFSISGPYLTLSKDGNSIRLKTYCLTENDNGEIRLSGYSLQDSPLIGELDYFTSSNMFNYAVKRDGSFYDMSAYKLCEDGRMTLYLSWKDDNGNEQEFTAQYAYILQSNCSPFLTNCSVVLLDGEKEYYYTDSVTAREARILKEDGESVSQLSDEEIKEIAEKKSDLFDDLNKEFQSKGIDVTINRATGEIAMDASVLFGGDSAEITEDGKALLNNFLSAYTAIIYNDKYNGFIDKTRIEGHTAPVAGSTYESGLPLSQERADNVKNYCLSAETGVDTSKLAANLEAVGMSNSKPVYDSNGNVDLAACRRVSFRFIINIE